MPTLSYPSGDFQPFTKILSAEVNGKFNAIRTLLNTTKLDSTNVQQYGLTRDRLAAGGMDRCGHRRGRLPHVRGGARWERRPARLLLGPRGQRADRQRRNGRRELHADDRGNGFRDGRL